MNSSQSVNETIATFWLCLVTTGTLCVGGIRSVANGSQGVVTLALPMGYTAGATISGCMRFSNKTFMSAGIINGVTSTVTYPNSVGTQTLTFLTNQSAFQNDQSAINQCSATTA